ncbi:MAG TPA: glucose-6-phosphate isomerase [Pontimonas sp.]|nr:glucose-6-phosphate isomerase [Pontimonas sp.]
MTLSVELSGALAQSTLAARTSVASSGFVSSLLEQDATLWGPAAQPEAALRLGWTVHPATWSSVASAVMDLRAELVAEGITRVVLCGMGGSSLGPEVMAASASLPLSVIDSTHPDVIAPELVRDLSDTVIVVSSKSGGTLETDSQKRAFESALTTQGLNPTRHMVIVTDPGSPLHASAVESGCRVFEGDPTIGGRFSAISPFGLVPFGLAGGDLAVFLDNAANGFEQCTTPGENNPAVLLGVAIAHDNPAVNKLLLRADPAHPALGNWVEQLVAESTGKEGVGILPVVESRMATLPDARSVGPRGSGSDVELSGSLAELMLVWEYATAIACAQIEVNPFDQPNVESAKVAARELLESPQVEGRLEKPLDDLSLFAEPAHRGLQAVSDIPELLKDLAGERGYIALCIFAPRGTEGRWRKCAHALEHRTGRPVTLGFGPRFLHSTGQLHKGGAPEGVFLQVIETSATSVTIPGRDFDFWALLESQAHGDARVLAETGQPVISLTGTNDDVDRVMATLSTQVG